MFTILIVYSRSAVVHLVQPIVRAMDLSLDQCGSFLFGESLPVVGLGDFVVIILPSFQV